MRIPDILRTAIFRLSLTAVLIVTAAASIVRADRILERGPAAKPSPAVVRQAKLHYEYAHFKLPQSSYLQNVRVRDFHLTGSNSRERLASAQSFIQLHGSLPQTPFMNYLRWRRSLNHARFDHYHPLIGPLLGEDAAVRAKSVIPPPPIGSSDPSPPTTITDFGLPGGPPHHPPGNQPNGAPSVPEPASFALLGIGIGVWFGIRRRLLIAHESRS